jgi:hypothetical protein
MSAVKAIAAERGFSDLKGQRSELLMEIWREAKMRQ